MFKYLNSITKKVIKNCNFVKKVTRNLIFVNLIEGWELLSLKYLYR